MIFLAIFGAKFGPSIINIVHGEFRYHGKWGTGSNRRDGGLTVGRHIGLQFYCGVTTFVVEFFGWISVGLFRLFIQTSVICIFIVDWK